MESTAAQSKGNFIWNTFNQPLKVLMRLAQVNRSSKGNYSALSKCSESSPLVSLAISSHFMHKC